MKTLWKIIISHIQYRKQILQLAKTDLIKTYRGALLSWGWAILKPAITIAVYYFAFTVGLRTGKPVKGYPYFLWLISGFIPWFYISAIYTGGAYSLHKYAFLVKKIKFPVCCVPMIVSLSNMIVHLALTLLMVIIFIAMGAPVTIYLAQLPFYWLLMLMMGVAWGLFSGQVTAVSKDFYQLVRSSFTALMWLSGIFYQISDIKGAALRFILRLNPVTYIVECFLWLRITNFDTLANHFHVMASDTASSTMYGFGRNQCHCCDLCWFTCFSCFWASRSTAARKKPSRMFCRGTI